MRNDVYTEFRTPSKREAFIESTLPQYLQLIREQTVLMASLVATNNEITKDKES
jgi:hypothetical protein